MGQSLGSYKAPGLTKNISGPEEINILKTFSHKINRCQKLPLLGHIP